MSKNMHLWLYQQIIDDPASVPTAAPLAAVSWTAFCGEIVSRDAGRDRVLPWYLYNKNPKELTCDACILLLFADPEFKRRIADVDRAY
jgi:hypothetical protein